MLKNIFRDQYMIPIYNPDIKKYNKYALDAINTGWISNHGLNVQNATNKLNDCLNTKYSILMANGTCSTHCLFLALKFKYPNIKKIYVSNCSYVAAWNVAIMEYPIDMIEVMKMDENTCNIDVSEDYIKTLESDAAVLIVHNLGNIVNVPRLKQIRPDLIFIEDNCEGLFGKYQDIYSGTSNDSLCSSCSFYGNKIITTGEGGGFITQDKDVYNYIKSVYSQGMTETKFLHDKKAYNYRMTNIEAGFLLAQLEDIDTILKRRYEIFEIYDNLFTELANNKKVKLITHKENTKYAPWIYAIHILNNNTSITEKIKFFSVNNVDIRPFFYPINSHEHLKTIYNDDHVSYKLNSEVILIPSSTNITFDEQKYVVDIVSKFVSKTV